MGHLYGILRFRLGMGMTGLRLRARTLFSVVLVLGGIGGAIGYGVVRQVLRDLEDEDQDPTGPSPR